MDRNFFEYFVHSRWAFTYLVLVLALSALMVIVVLLLRWVCVRLIVCLINRKVGPNIRRSPIYIGDDRRSDPPSIDRDAGHHLTTTTSDNRRHLQSPVEIRRNDVGASFRVREFPPAYESVIASAAQSLQQQRPSLTADGNGFTSDVQNMQPSQSPQIHEGLITAVI